MPGQHKTHNLHKRTNLNLGPQVATPVRTCHASSRVSCSSPVTPGCGLVSGVPEIAVDHVSQSCRQA